MSIGERISKLRKEASLSQYELAKVLGVSRQAVSKWENNQAAPDTINLIRLSDVLCTEVDYLATGNKPDYTPPAIVDKIHTVEKIVEVEKIIKVPEIVEKPTIKFKYRIKYIRNPLEFVTIGIICFIIGMIIGLLL